jgi:hypothetical protein
MNKRLIGLALATMAAGATACDSAARPSNQGEMVADTMVGDGVRLEILALEDGSFVSTQSGRPGSRPVEVPAAIVQSGDPVALFQYLAPRQEVPQALIAADARAGSLVEKRRRATGVASTPTSLADSLSAERRGTVGIPLTGDIHATLGATESNWTDMPGCSIEFFDRNWCPPSQSDDVPAKYCFYHKTWAFLEHDSALAGWGAVCADQGQLTFRITAGDAVEFTVDQGSWRTAVVLRKAMCGGFFGCTDIRQFMRFEIVPRPDESSGHFAAHVDF